MKYARAPAVAAAGGGRSSRRVSLAPAYFPFLRFFALEVLTGDLAADQTGKGFQGSVITCGITPIRFRTGRGPDLDIDPVPLDCHRLQNPRPQEGGDIMEARNAFVGKGARQASRSVGCHSVVKGWVSQRRFPRLLSDHNCESSNPACSAIYISLICRGMRDSDENYVYSIALL